VTALALVAASPRYRLQEAILWTVEEDGICVFDDLCCRRLHLPYPEAAVWDMMARGRSLADIVAIMPFVADLPAAEAARLVERCVNHWLENKLICLADAGG
jgi:hypothetical protein